MDASLRKLFRKNYELIFYNGNGHGTLTAATPSSRGVDGNPASDKDATAGRPVAANCCATQFIPDTLITISDEIF